MNFVEELRCMSKQALEDVALDASVEIQIRLKEFAKKGQTECYMNPIGYEEIMLNDEFIKLLKLLLEVDVEIVERSVSSLSPSLKRKEIRFRW